VEKYVTAIEGRIDALARSHILLSVSHWKGADLKEIVEKELAPFNTGEGGRLEIEGPSTLLQPAAAQSLTLVIHELATNAAKYGSMSTTTGRLRVKFDLRPDTLVIDWLEQGGPGIAAPKTSGFGSKLISISMRHLHGDAQFDWTDGGLKCRLILPLGIDLEKADESVANGQEVSKSAAANGKLTALLVEDEPLVAMMMADVLSDFDFTVLGPFASVDRAIAAVDGASLHVALLDINLRGEMVYPVAARLRELGVPFIFMTGYAPEGVLKEFNDAPILKKPVDQIQLYQTIQRVTEIVPMN
jgi:CheY-like chemotaxis protein